MTPQRTLVLAAVLATGGTLAAQPEAYWVANRGSQDVTQVAQLGEALQTVPRGTGLRSAHAAPDGKVWVVRFIQAQFDILNPDGSLFQTINYGQGNPYDIAFDANGHAWVSGGNGVEEFDANGNLQQSIPLATGAPLGICVDSDNNKWIAHRIGPPGVISRIDGTTGTVTNQMLPGTSSILPTRCYADSRGSGNSSHIWVIGDRGGELVEFDANANLLQTITLDSAGSFGSIVADVDPTNNIVDSVWVGDFRNGNVWRYEVSTGNVSSFTGGSTALGLAIDGFGKLWVTDRSNTEVRRFDIPSGTFEVAVPVGSGVQSAIATGWAHATTVAPQGDWDGDGVPNLFETLNATSLFDACSTPAYSLQVDGTTSLGSTTTLRIVGNGQTALALGTGLSTSSVSLPTVTCDFHLDLSQLFPASLSFSGSSNVTVPIPNLPALQGVTLYTQGLNINRGQAAFTNVTGWAIY